MGLNEFLFVFYEINHEEVFLNIIILIVFSLLGWEIGTGNLSSLSQKPSGNWEMVLHSKRPMFGDVTYNWPNKILYVEDASKIYLVVDDDSTWVCVLESNQCTKTNINSLALRDVILISHVVPKTEIPPLPNESNIEDILKLGEDAGVAGIYYVYYVLLTDGTIWRWYGSGTGGEYSDIFYWFGGIGWVIFLDVIAIIIIISLNQKPNEIAS